MIEQIRKYIFFFSIGLLIIGLPFSRAMISIGEVGMLIAWLFDRDIAKKFKIFLQSKAALAFTSIYLVHIIGLLYTSNFDYAFFDLRTKLPLLLFPMIFVSSPSLSTRELRNFLLLFAATATASISYSLLLFQTQNLADFRDAFPFISHIRLSLEVLISISIIMFYGQSQYQGIGKYGRWFLLIIPFYLIWAMFVLELMTGIAIFGVGVSLFLIRFLLANKNRRAPWIGFFSGISIVVIFFFWLSFVITEYRNAPDFDLNTIERITSNGNTYEHTPDLYQVENGSYIGLYICRAELRTQWNKLSKMDFDGPDNRNQELSMTLIRYLNSLNLRKDEQGVNKLASNDIINIENGIANAEFAKKFSLKKRIFKLIWEYNLYQDGNPAYGHSLVQRFVLWRTAVNIFAENPVFGVGTGDVRDAFQEEFINEKSSFIDSGLRSHNQYLSFAVTLGAIGLIIFLFSLIYPATQLKMWSFSPYFYLFVIMTLSMFWEDTIESQVGVTIYAFFSSIYLFTRKKL
ncbi:MAG: hypothetical protein DRI84_00300 [Bacteroidetes bacterium]|nr:MAG: hypothetical protein DRI84_00300 [Bacteroidota bacterium]